MAIHRQRLVVETADELLMIRRTLCLLRMHDPKLRGDDGNVYYECKRCQHRWVRIYDKAVAIRQRWLDGGRWQAGKNK